MSSDTNPPVHVDPSSTFAQQLEAILEAIPQSKSIDQLAQRFIRQPLDIVQLKDLRDIPTDLYSISAQQIDQELWTRVNKLRIQRNLSQLTEIRDLSSLLKEHSKRTVSRSLEDDSSPLSLLMQSTIEAVEAEARKRLDRHHHHHHLIGSISQDAMKKRPDDIRDILTKHPEYASLYTLPSSLDAEIIKQYHTMIHHEPQVIDVSRVLFQQLAMVLSASLLIAISQTIDMHIQSICQKISSTLSQGDGQIVSSVEDVKQTNTHVKRTDTVRIQDEGSRTRSSFFSPSEPGASAASASMNVNAAHTSSQISSGDDPLAHPQWQEQTQHTQISEVKSFPEQWKNELGIISQIVQDLGHRLHSVATSTASSDHSSSSSTPATPSSYKDNGDHHHYQDEIGYLLLLFSQIPFGIADGNHLVEFYRHQRQQDQQEEKEDNNSIHGNSIPHLDLALPADDILHSVRDDNEGRVQSLSLKKSNNKPLIHHHTDIFYYILLKCALSMLFQQTSLIITTTAKATTTPTITQTTDDHVPHKHPQDIITTVLNDLHQFRSQVNAFLFPLLTTAKQQCIDDISKSTSPGSTVTHSFLERLSTWSDLPILLPSTSDSSTSQSEGDAVGATPSLRLFHLLRSLWTQDRQHLTPSTPKDSKEIQMDELSQSIGPRADVDVVSTPQNTLPDSDISTSPSRSTEQRSNVRVSSDQILRLLSTPADRDPQPPVSGSIGDAIDHVIAKYDKILSKQYGLPVHLQANEDGEQKKQQAPPQHQQQQLESHPSTISSHLHAHSHPSSNYPRRDDRTYFASSRFHPQIQTSSDSHHHHHHHHHRRGNNDGYRSNRGSYRDNYQSNQPYQSNQISSFSHAQGGNIPGGTVHSGKGGYDRRYPLSSEPHQPRRDRNYYDGYRDRDRDRDRDRRPY